MEDSIPIDADFTVEKTEDAEDEYEEDPDNEYADFNYAGMKAKKERELRQRSRIVVVMMNGMGTYSDYGLGSDYSFYGISQGIGIGAFFAVIFIAAASIILMLLFVWLMVGADTHCVAGRHRDVLLGRVF